MKSSKIVALSALAALAFGVGTAMAQNSSVPAGTYATQPQANGTSAPATRQDSTVQYGSSDHGFPAQVRDTDRAEGGF